MIAESFEFVPNRKTKSPYGKSRDRANRVRLHRQAFSIEPLERRLLLSVSPAVATPSLTLIGDNSSATVSIPDGEAGVSQAAFTDFGPTVDDGSVPVTRSYTITNAGTATLDTIGATPVTITGPGAADFTVVSQPGSTIVAGGTTTFEIQFKPTSTGDATDIATVNIDSNDPVNPNFTYEIQGESLHMNEATSGLDTFVNGTGTGAATQDNELLVIDYTGYLTDGTKFDSSLNPGRTPFQFVLGIGSVIKGWDQGLVGLQTGENEIMVIPSALAYGPSGQGSIPANSTLIFITTLHDIVSVSGSGQFIGVGENSPVSSNDTDFGSTSVTNTFTINDPGGNLSTLLATPMVSLSGSGASAFTMTQPTINGAGTQATFTVTYTPAGGISTATVVVNNATAASSNPNVPFTIEGEAPAADDGSVSEADTTQISGFAFSPLDLTETVNVEIAISGETTQTVAANQSNAVVQTLTGSADHGFVYTTPALSAGSHTVDVDAMDPGTGSVTLIGSSTIVVAAAATAVQNSVVTAPAIAALANESDPSPSASLASDQTESPVVTPDFADSIFTASSSDILPSVTSAPFSNSDQSLLDGQDTNLLQ